MLKLMELMSSLGNSIKNFESAAKYCSTAESMASTKNTVKS
jgi:hypothetical protein